MDESSRTCPNCGSSISAQASSCRVCGKPVLSQDQPNLPPPERATAVPRCPFCNALLSASAKFCPSCGKPTTLPDESFPRPSVIPSVLPLAPIPQSRAQASAHSYPVRSTRSATSRRGVWLVGGIAALFVVCICLAAGLVASVNLRLFPNLNMPGSAQLFVPGLAVSSQTSFTLSQTVSAPADGNPHSDERGVGVQIPQGALAEGAAAQMNAYAPAGALVQTLNRDFKLETPFYQVQVPGKDSATGRATLSFPISNPGAQVIALIDQKYVAFVGGVFQDGALRVKARVAPQDLTGLKRAAANTAAGDIRYAVISPKTSSMPAAPPSGKLVAGRLAPLTGPTLAEPNCYHWGTASETGSSWSCHNQARTVSVTWNDPLKMTPDDGMNVIRMMEDTMGKYYSLGFTAAELSAWFPMQVVVDASVQAPNYKASNGVLYLPLDAAQHAKMDRSLAHEIAHYLQDGGWVGGYNMIGAYWSGGSKYWWIETSAENMVMLILPDYVGENLAFYGKIASDNNSTAFQFSPFQWPLEEFYVQAQVVKLNMCANAACPISQASFVQAINKASYPFNDSSAQKKVSDNLEDYARYLLGTPPLKSNTGIPLMAAKTGEYGDAVVARQGRSGELDFQITGYPPQIQAETKDGTKIVVVKAPLQKDSVYPLRVMGASDTRVAGLPVALTVKPGTGLLYRTDDAAPKSHDGSKELVIQPINATMGISNVRLVALGKNGGETMQAQIAPVDLGGAWIVIQRKLVRNGIQCTSSDPKTLSGGLKPEGVVALQMMASALGDFKGDPGTPGSLTWTLAPSRIPAGSKPSDLQFQGQALVGGDSIQLQTQLVIPQKKSSESLPIFVGATALLSPAALLGRRFGKKWAVLGVGILLIVLVLLMSGCFGFELYGRFDGNVTFKKLEYIGGKGTVVIGATEDLTAQPIWKMSNGKAVYQTDFTAVVTTDSEAGKAPEKAVMQCTGDVEYEVDGNIVENVVIKTGN